MYRLNDEDNLAVLEMELYPIREELVERVKTQIAAGTYETAEKLDAAVQTLLLSMLKCEEGELV